MMLNVAAVHEIQKTASLGRLLMVWLQGCRKCCRGCMNIGLLPLIPRWLVSADELLAHLHPGLEGLCFSGGEPFLQAADLATLAREARSRGFATISYSGYTIEELMQNVVPQARELLAELDVLIDGEFVQELAGTYLWRGSSNQRIHLLTDRYGPELLASPPTTSVQVADGTALTVGTENSALKRLLEALDEMGVALTSPVSRETA